MAARNALLRYLRVSVNPSPALPSSFALLRRFSEEVRGSFLDKSDVTDRVISVVKNFQRVDPSKVTPKAHFINDLGLDSLDNVEVVMALEEEFGFEIPDNDADKIQSVDLAVDFIASHPQAIVNPINKLFHSCIGSSFPEDWKRNHSIHHRRIHKPEVLAMNGFLALPCSKKLCSGHHALLLSF
ncbi:BnaA07g25220D [Brassica napus]|uniref:Acyl carrier protein n=1 Tax=Brassica napus TaxID=3708 RepID=A0A078F731_BRANA|nr:unnamed protein product [Brassica napus]CDY07443.1 BnaA07g25220D [Brassica napus]